MTFPISPFSGAISPANPVGATAIAQSDQGFMDAFMSLAPVTSEVAAELVESSEKPTDAGIEPEDAPATPTDAAAEPAKSLAKHAHAAPEPEDAPLAFGMAPEVQKPEVQTLHGIRDQNTATVLPPQIKGSGTGGHDRDATARHPAVHTVQTGDVRGALHFVPDVPVPPSDTSKQPPVMPARALSGAEEKQASLPSAERANRMVVPAHPKTAVVVLADAEREAGADRDARPVAASSRENQVSPSLPKAFSVAPDRQTAPDLARPQVQHADATMPFARAQPDFGANAPSTTPVPLRRSRHVPATPVPVRANATPSDVSSSDRHGAAPERVAWRLLRPLR